MQGYPRVGEYRDIAPSRYTNNDELINEYEIVQNFQKNSHDLFLKTKIGKYYTVTNSRTKS